MMHHLSGPPNSAKRGSLQERTPKQFGQTFTILLQFYEAKNFALSVCRPIGELTNCGNSKEATEEVKKDTKL